MDDVLDLLLMGVSDFVATAKAFQFTALGFDVTLWHLYCALFVLSCLLPVFFSLRRAPMLGDLIPGHGGSGVSERAPTLEQETANAISSGQYDVDIYANKWADYYERNGL